MESEKQPWWKKLAKKVKALKKKEKKSNKKFSTRMTASTLTRTPMQVPALISTNASASTSEEVSGLVSQVGLSTVNVDENHTENENEMMEEMADEDELLEDIDTILWFQNRRLSRDFTRGGVFRFLDLPRELRDEIYRHLFIYTHPLARQWATVNCSGVNCGRSNITYGTILPVRVLRTCRQIRNEGQLVLYQENSWTLQTAALVMDRQLAVLLYNKHLFDTSTRHPYISFIRTLDFPINIAPHAHRYLSGVEIMSLRDTPLWRLILRSPFETYYSIFEAEECERMELVLKRLALVQRRDFPHLQTIMISLAFHFEGDADCLTCDRQLTIQVKLNPLERRRTSIHPPSAWPFEPRRHILTPLADLGNVQSVVVRRQLVPTQAPASSSGVQTATVGMVNVQTFVARPLLVPVPAPASSSGAQTATAGSNAGDSQLVWTFSSIGSMLFSAGYKFENFNTRQNIVFPDGRVHLAVTPPGLGVWTGV